MWCDAGALQRRVDDVAKQLDVQRNRLTSDYCMDYCCDVPICNITLVTLLMQLTTIIQYII